MNGMRARYAISNSNSSRGSITVPFSSIKNNAFTMCKSKFRAIKTHISNKRMSTYLYIISISKYLRAPEHHENNFRERVWMRTMRITYSSQIAIAMKNKRIQFSADAWNAFGDATLLRSTLFFHRSFIRSFHLCSFVDILCLHAWQ